MVLQAEEENPDLASSPLEKLDCVLQSISPDHADSLKRELLLGVVPSTESDMQSSNSFFGQKPISFDPLTGSITVPSIPGRCVKFPCFYLRPRSFALSTP